MHALNIDHLTLRRGSQTILRDVTLEISAGERVAIVGPNGSGKTTLLRALAGLIQPTRGDIWIDGILKTPANVGIKSRIGYVGHSPHLYPHLTAHENLLFLARLFEIPDHRERIAVTLDAIGLSAQADRLVREFSRGMQQRLALGAAMLHNPLVLLLIIPDLVWGDTAYLLIPFTSAGKRGNLVYIHASLSLLDKKPLPYLILLSPKQFRRSTLRKKQLMAAEF